MSEIENLRLKANLDRFATHKATVILDSDRYFVVDWRREDGSGDYYINFIVDKERGSLIVSGDLGDSIATWYGRHTPQEIANYIRSDVGYYVGKMRCSSDKYVYSAKDIITDMKEHISDEDILSCCENKTPDEFWDDIDSELESCVFAQEFIVSESLIDMVSEIDDSCYEWLSYCGKRISMRPYLWAAGFNMALNQLKAQNQ